MKEVLKKIEKLKKTEIGKQVNQRIKEFQSFGTASSNDIFKELCFCLLTANWNAAGGIKIQNELGNDFLNDSEEQLAKKLVKHRHRFPNARAKYIFEAQKYKDSLKHILTSHPNGKLARQWLVENVKGLGMKESSHFLRNIGYSDVAIIDFHIIDLMIKEGLIEKPKTITPKKYVEIENILSKLAEKSNLGLDELDLYLWYIETGKILK